MLAHTTLQTSLNSPRLMPFEGSTGQRRKVLLFYPDFGAMGGIERYILTVADFLKGHPEFQPVVVCSGGTPLHKALVSMGIPTHGLKTLPVFQKALLRPLDLATQFQLIGVIRQEQPDIVHVHIGHLENLIFSLLSLPVVYTVHGYGTLYSMAGIRSPIKHWVKGQIREMFRRSLAEMNAVTFVSASELERMAQEGYLSESVSAKVLYNGIDLAAIQARLENSDVKTLRQELGIPEEARVVSFISRMDANKNPLSFLTLAENLAQQSELGSLWFVVAGSGPLAPAFAKALRRSPVRSQTLYFPHREDVIEILAASDLTVQVPLKEGFGLGVLEALACGTPCVSYAAGAIPEVMDIPQAKACLAPVGDLDSMVIKAADVLRLSAEERQALIKALKARAKDFNLPRFQADLLATYTSVLEVTHG